MKKTIIILTICLTSTAPVLSQEFQDVVPAETEEELDEICKTAYLGYMSTPAEIEEAVNDILKTVGIKSIDQAKFTLKGCDKINNAIAKILKDNKGKEVRYVLYDPQLLQKIIDKTNNVWSAKFILAHEIGHHMLGHSLNNGTSSHEYELAADYFAGRALAMMGASEMETTSATSILPERASSTHPARKDRLAKAKEGWNSVERAKVIKVRPEDINDIGRNMVQRVSESLSNYNSLSVGDFQKNFKALTVARTKYYKAYTEDIRYLEALCLTGMGEKSKAENACINYLSIEDLDNQERIEQIIGIYLDSKTDKPSFFRNPKVLFTISNQCFERSLYEKAINYGNQYLQFSNPKKDAERISKIIKVISDSEYEKITNDNEPEKSKRTNKDNYPKRDFNNYENRENPNITQFLRNQDHAQATKAIMANYLKAIGGVDAVQKVETIMFKAYVNHRGMNLDVLVKKMGNKSLFVMSMNGSVVMKSAFNGQSGYSFSAGTKTLYTQEQVAQSKNEFIFPELHSPDAVFEKIGAFNGKGAYVIKMGEGFWAYYDMQTGLKLGTRTISMGQTQNIFLEDYREVRGMKFPFAMINLSNQIRLEMNITEWRINQGVSAVDFE